MAKKEAARIQSLLRTAKTADHYLKSNLDSHELVLLNMTDKPDEMGFFEKQVRETHLRAALKLNKLFKLDMKIDETDLANSDKILPEAIDTLKRKLEGGKTFRIKTKDDKEIDVSIKDTMGGLNRLLSEQDSLVKDLFRDIYGEIRKEKSATAIRSFLQPFQNIWEFVRHKISSLFLDIQLTAQVQEGADFQNIDQSTHLPWVHKSVKRSMDALDFKNPRPQNSQEKKQLHDSVYGEVSEHIKKMDMDANKKQYALNTLNRAYKGDTYVEQHSGRTIMETLATMWVAAKDHQAYGPDDSDEGMNNRLDTICQHLALADREYNMNEAGVDKGGKSKPACRGGTVNKIVEALELIHPDVKIIRGVDILSDFAKEEVASQFSKLAPEDQIAIYEDDDVVLDKSKDLYKKVEDKLNDLNDEIFDGEVPADKIKGWVDNLKYAVPITDVIKEHKEKKAAAEQQKQQAQQAQVSPKAQEKIIKVDERVITAEEINKFEESLKGLRNSPLPPIKNLTDENKAKRAVKSVFSEDEDFFKTLLDNNSSKLDQLAKALLDRNAPQVQVNPTPPTKVEEPKVTAEKKITIDGHDITTEKIKDFNEALDSLKTNPSFSSQSDEELAKLVIQSEIDPNIWNDSNIDQLADALLKNRNESQVVVTPTCPIKVTKNMKEQLQQDQKEDVEVELNKGFGM